MTSTTPTPPTTKSLSQSGRVTSHVALRRAAVVALVAIGAIASTGCDNADSRAAREALQQAAIARKVADPAKAAQGVEAKLGTLSPADSVQLAHARSILAGAKLAAVRAKLPELQSAEAEVIASLSAVDATVAIAASAAADATTLAKRDPAGTITEVQKVAANTRGDGNAPLAFSQELVDANGKSVKVEIPSRAAVTLRISELNGAITRTSDQIAKMNEELAAHNVAAGQAALAAESGKTAEERLAKLDEAKDHRIEAATRSQEIANAEAALEQLKAQLAGAENQKASLDASVQALDARIETLKASSTAVTAAVADRRKSAAALLSADALDPVDKVTERKPSEVLAKADELRKSILDDYAAVLKAYDEAAAAGANVAKELAGDSSAPEAAVWQSTIETVAAPRYKLAAASAKLDVAGVHYAHALLLAKQNEIAQSLDAVFKTGGLTGSAPETLNAAETSKALAEAIEAANAAYNETGALVDGAMGSSSKVTKNGATVLKPYVLYGQSQVVALAERAGVKITVSEGSDTKAQTSKDLLAAAKAAAKEAVEQNLPVGHLPSEFADVMPKKEVAPETPAATAAKPAETAPGASPSAAAGTEDPAVTEAVHAVAKRIQDAIIEGDEATLTSLYILEPGGESKRDTLLKLAATSKRFIDAFDAKFPGQREQVITGMKSGAARAIGERKVTTTGDEALMQMEGNDRPNHYRKQDGEWKLVLRASETQPDPAEAFVQKRIATIETITKEIESGAISDMTQIPARMAELTAAEGSAAPTSAPAGEAAPSGEAPPAAPTTPPPSGGETPPAAP